MAERDIIRTSKFLTLILRHEPERVGLKLDSAGWAAVDELPQAVSKHGVVLPSGIDIDLPLWVFKRLKKLHLLERDRPTGKMRIRPHLFGFMALWHGPDFRPDRRYRAFDPGYQKAHSKDSGYASAFLKALVRDCSVLVNPAPLNEPTTSNLTSNIHVSPTNSVGRLWTPWA